MSVFGSFQDVVKKRKEFPTGEQMTDPAPRPPAPQVIGPQAAAPTFAEMQKQGRARPAPPASTMGAGPSPFGGQAAMPPGAMNPFAAQPAGNIGGAVQNSIFGLLQNPSRYDQDAVQRTYGMLSGRIDDEFNQRRTGIEEDSARRGLSDSSIRGGRLADTNVEQRSAQVELADRLANQQAQTYGTDLNSAIATALGYGQQNFGQQLATSQFNQGQQQIDWQQLMAMLGLGTMGG
jgi:hypothetical protein